MMYRLLLLLFIFASRGALLYAQDTKSVKWEAHGLALSVPADFVINDKQAGGFFGNDAYLSLSIRAWTDVINESNFTSKAEAEAMDLGYSETTPWEKLELKGLKGYSTTSMRNERYCLLGFLQAGSENFVLTVCYEEGWAEVAKSIFRSASK